MNEVLDLLAPYVLRLCRPIAFDDAEDAAQEALTQIFRRLDRLQEPSAIRRWARTIAVREAVRAASGRGGAVPVEQPPEVDAAAIDHDLTLDVRRRLAALPAPQRAVLVLRELEDLSEEDVARLLEVAPGTVKSRLHRARRRFAEGWSR
jgi:RNA polymerase sigma factor (sigma-70 family)